MVFQTFFNILKCTKITKKSNDFTIEIVGFMVRLTHQQTNFRIYAAPKYFLLLEPYRAADGRRSA